MKLKEIRVDIPGSGVLDASFYLHFDGRTTSVGEIKIHTDFDSTLPHRAFLKQDTDGKWKLFDEHPEMQNNELKVLPEFLNDSISNQLVERILEIVADES